MIEVRTTASRIRDEESIADIARALREGQSTVPEIALQAVSRARRAQGLTGGLLDIFDVADTAQQAQKAIDDGQTRSALHGIPFAIKDNFAVAGWARRGGSRIRHELQQEDAVTVARAKELGAVPVGLTRMHELGLGSSGLNEHDGGTLNPIDHTRVAGGSSSGSAVSVAERSSVFALGTDTGGSVRIPASLCGVVGYKPSFGSISLEGVLPLAPSFDHVGLLARRVTDVETVARLLWAPGQPYPPINARRPRRTAGTSMVVGVLEWESSSAPAVTRAMRTAMQRLHRGGHEIVRMPFTPMREIWQFSSTVVSYEAHVLYGKEAMDDRSAMGDAVRARIKCGASISPEEYQEARNACEELKREWNALLNLVDVVATPTVGCVAPRKVNADRPDVLYAYVAFTRLGNATGAPAISLPIATGGRLPAGLQLMGHVGDDVRLLDQALEVERILGPWHVNGRN